ncbi:MAG: hypothetical protein FK731_13600 [Asgard group archaeon]|nr:hypothetical protein [Asgard group archaeon]
MSIQESWLDYKSKRFINFFYKPFVIYGKQFLKLLIFSLIVEFFFFGISRLIIFNVEVDYSLYTTLPFISIEVDFVSDFGRAFFFILLILAIVFFIIRSTLITNTAKLTIEKGRANLVIVIENTVKKVKEILVFTLLIVTILVFPFLMITLAILMMMRNHYLAWSMILFAIIVPYIFLPKISLYTAGMAKDNLHVGSAIQQSWYLTGRKNWSKSSIFFVLFSFISIIGPWLLTIYLNQRHGYPYLGLIMTLIRGFLFPLYDSAMTYNYFHFSHNTIEESVFKEDILKQEARSEEFIRKVREKRVKDV